MDLGLRGKTTLVSGSTAGIGFAIATAFAAEGAKVIINGRTEPRVTTALENIRQPIKIAHVRRIPADLGTAQEVAAFLQQAPEADILVNNIGIFEIYNKSFLEIPDSDWFLFFELNVLSGVRLSRRYLPGMLRKNWGRVIFFSSESAHHIPAEMIQYGMTKTAQVAFAWGLAESVAGTGVTVNSILVGPTDSEGVGVFVESMAKPQGGTKAEIEKQCFSTVRPSWLLKRLETPEEVAAVVAFFAGTRATAINGSAVRAEGGVLRSIFQEYLELSAQVVRFPIPD